MTPSASTSGVIAGVDWVTGNHLAGQSRDGPDGALQPDDEVDRQKLEYDQQLPAVHELLARRQGGAAPARHRPSYSVP
jgi:hypothetical protein